MTKVIHKTGDIFTTKAPAIGHGVNCKGAMASGIAVEFKNRFKTMHKRYVELCEVGGLKPGMVMPWQTENGGVIYNIASQDLPGANAKYTWLEEGLRTAVMHASVNGVPVIAIPRIGAGVGGLDWKFVLIIIEKIAAETDVNLEVWTYKEPESK